MSDQPDPVLADADHWHTAQVHAIAGRGMEVLVPPDGNQRAGIRPGWEKCPYQEMRDRLATDHGRELKKLRTITIEPCSGRSNTTATSTGPCEEAGPPPGQSGD